MEHLQKVAPQSTYVGCWHLEQVAAPLLRWGWQGSEILSQAEGHTFSPGQRAPQRLRLRLGALTQGGFVFSGSFEAMAAVSSTASPERAPVRIVTAEWLKEHLEAGGWLWLQLAWPSLAFHGPFKGESESCRLGFEGKPASLEFK